MKPSCLVWAAIAAVLVGCKPAPELDSQTALRLQEIRNLGKAFYENPGSANLAVEELKKGVELAPDSPRERLNYGLALLRAGEREAGLAQVELAQASDPSIPHTYFNLGVEYKKAGEAERAIEQFERMAELTPDEAKVHYNLGQLYKQVERQDDAIAKFELTSKLDPSLAAPHFQLFNIFRREDRDRAQVELAEFKRIKAIQEATDKSEDVNWSFFSELYDPVEAAALQAAEPGYETSAVAQLQQHPGGSLLVLDVNVDRQPDLLAWNRESSVLLINDQGDLVAREDSELAYGLLTARGIAAGDADNDGYPDLCVAGEGGGSVFRNRGGTFPQPHLFHERDFESCLFSDMDHDGDLDVFFFGKLNLFYRNVGGEQLFAVEEFPFENKPAFAAVAVELYEDDGIDLVIAYADEVVVYEDRKLGRFDADVRIPISPGPMRVVDLDNDGYLDVTVGTQALHNNGGKLELGSTVEITPLAADFNADGLLDQASLDGPNVNVALNQTPSNYANIALTGVKSLKTAHGARVEVKSGPHYQKQVYQGIPLTFALGDRESIDTVRITWPNGLIQNEIQQPVNQTLSIEEKPRLSGSCPMVFTFNGEEFEYISEVLGVAPLGASLGDGQFFPVDHDEYVLIRGDQLVERDGFYEVRITEELRETAYIDEVKLLVVDHAPDVEIYSNEKAKAPPFPEFELFGVRERIRPTRAVDHHGHDVLEKVIARDSAYADTFERTFRNTAEMHSLTLAFPGLPRKARLFLHGWVDWSSASSIVGLSQTAQPLAPPILQVRDASGEWQTVNPDLGLPGGAPRTITTDVEFLSDSREVRIVTNMCLYWDEAFATPDVPTSVSTPAAISAASAELRFRGFSKNITHPARTQPETFVYADVSPVSTWNPTPGLYTRFGEVSELLAEEDDRLVVLGAGDEIALRFQAPPPARGMKRDFLLKVDGWAKEREANTAFGDSVEPLPFHEMSSYPYPEPFAGRDELRTRPALRLIRPLHN